MKVLKNISIVLLNILILATSVVALCGGMFYILPALTSTELGSIVSSVVTANVLLYLTIGCCVAFIIFSIIEKVLSRDSWSKFSNFFIHFISFVMCLEIIGLALYTFIFTNPLISSEIVITSARKISIGVCLGALVIFHVLQSKLSTLINRRIQAYETAKEMNTVGRGSVVLTNILKLFELLFPEMIVLLLLCFCISWQVASYFIIVLVACLIPMIGNILCDFNIRREIKRNDNIAEKKLVSKIRESRRGRK